MNEQGEYHLSKETLIILRKEHAKETKNFLEKHNYASSCYLSTTCENPNFDAPTSKGSLEEEICGP